MHPLLSDVRKLFCYLALWLLAGTGAAGLLRLSGLADWPSALWFAVPVCLFYGFAALSAYYVCRSLPYAQRRWPLAIAVFGGSSLLSALAWWAVSALWNGSGRFFGLEAGIVSMPPNGWVIFTVAGFGLYLLSILAHDVLIAFERVQEAAQREAQARVLAREAELQLLRTQIDPHFLFNSLNSISALTSFDAAAARAMAIDLAQFFRRTLALSGQERIALAEEAALCESFLAVERRRLGDKLGFALRIDAEAGSCLVPPMMLQPLVENAVKHGIRQLDSGGVIVVEALTRGGWLHVAVENPAPEQPATQPGHGLGLRNIRERLTVQYGERARIAWQRDGARFRVELTLPAEQEGHR